ncbi:putative polygalacturonase [Lupinus albus]|uniref:Putative polygalacturonase n=1 Tax=Lupinus albus TaxID=3870 RepID=A0A6A4NSJ7_LUPAL|nr:putative polygalacturonase [Lupinus albus]
MDLLIISLLIFSIASCNFWAGNGQNTFNVCSYGAKGDGHFDDSEAFGKAWEAMCGSNESTTIPTLLVPGGYTFYVSQTEFKGPCKSNQVHIQVHIS